MIVLVTIRSSRLCPQVASYATQSKAKLLIYSHALDTVKRSMISDDNTTNKSISTMLQSKYQIVRRGN